MPQDDFTCSITLSISRRKVAVVSRGQVAMGAAMKTSYFLTSAGLDDSAGNFGEPHFQIRPPALERAHQLVGGKRPLSNQPFIDSSNL